MYVADTNVLSELMRSQSAPGVSRWASITPLDQIFTTSINQAEVLVGIAVLPPGRRRTGLADAADRLFKLYFAGKVLPFDSPSSEAFARIVALRRRAGRPIQTVDAQIAGIVAANQATLVTRDVADFAGCGFDVLNPWTA